MDTPAIELKDVWFSYNGEMILKEITLTVEHTDFLVMIGPNGGGKTTLLRLILGLLAPDRGSIGVFGKQPARAMHRIGYVPQNIGINKGFPVSVLDVALMGRLGHRSYLRRYTKEDMSIAQKALETVDIRDLSKERVDNLSGGQRQRVYIARALAAEPDILLLDEPTASIDMEGQAKIYEIMKELNSRMTILVVSHDYALTLCFAKTVAHVNKTIHIHEALDFNPEMLRKLSESSLKNICPVELITQGYLQMHTQPSEGSEDV